MVVKKALVILAPGAEEMETVIIVDVLRRAGMEVILAGLISADPVECSRSVKIVPDISLEEAMKLGPFDVVVLPGGVDGAKCLSESSKVKEVLYEQEKEGRCIAAVCAAPSALVAHGIAKGKTITSHPVMKESIQKNGNYSYSEARVCRDNTVITGRGPGTCFEFVFCIVEVLCGEKTAKDIAGPMFIKI